MLTSALAIYDSTADKVTFLDFVKDNMLAFFLATGFSALSIIVIILVLLRKARKAEAAAKLAANDTQKLNEKLEIALKKAEDASLAKTRFLNNMSHDIRTPMNAVLGFTSILAREADNPAKVRDCANKIMASGRHLLDLINDVLDISKIESGKASLTLAEFDLGDSLAAAESIIAPMARDKGQTFCAEIRSVRHERLIGDETHLNQILLNLLSNAVKYTPDGGHIRVTAGSEGETVWMEVADDGIGIPEADRSRIFERFYRVDKMRSRAAGGTGLGLSIAADTARRRGGSIEVRAREGGGTVFTVRLPRCEEGGDET